MEKMHTNFSVFLLYRYAVVEVIYLLSSVLFLAKVWN